MEYFERVGNSLFFRGEGETLVLCPWGVDSLRVRSRIQQEILDDRWALLEPEVCTADITMEGNRASIRNGAITAVLMVDLGHRCRVSYYDADGEPLLIETGSGGSLVLKPRHFTPAIGGDFALSVSFDGCDGEHLYGLGQYQLEELDLKHCTLELAQRNSQASVPFVLSSRGYGFLWHNPAIGEVTFGKNRTVWKAESTKQMDYWITAGESPKAISENYARATGFVPMMPEYGLGFWQCKLRYWNQEQLLSVAREYKRRGLPVDVIVCDFFHWPKMGDFRFDPECFPDPAAMVSELSEMGMELMVSVWPQIDMTSENYEEMRQQGLLVRAELGEPVAMRFVGNSMFLDTTNPRARAYVWEKCRKNYYDHGIRIFWLDEAEPEYGTYDYGNYRYHLGSNLQIGNLYPQLYARAFFDGMAALGQEAPVNLLRCAWAGSQRYGALVWSGDIHSDWKTFRQQVCAGLNMGMAGIPWWTTDIGGFHGGHTDDPAFRELLVRWFQWGAFCPVMRLHGNRQPEEQPLRTDGSPLLFSGADNEVWSFGEENYPILVKYLKLRERLRPYTHRLMREAHEHGTPLMRAMFYEFPGDSACHGLKDQYMFGPDLLIAPMMAPGATVRQVYLPVGSHWAALDGDETYEGGQTISANAPIDLIPVFVRDGADVFSD